MERLARDSAYRLSVPLWYRMVRLCALRVLADNRAGLSAHARSRTMDRVEEKCFVVERTSGGLLSVSVITLYQGWFSHPLIR